MGKKNYMRPFMPMELFRPNEYCDGCGDEQGYTLIAWCNSTEHNIQIFIGSEADRWYAIADNSGLEGTLERDQNDPTGNTWLFMGYINAGHDSQFARGEYVGLDDSAISQGKQVGDLAWGSGPQTYCAHQGVAAGQAHHHLMKKQIYKNQS